MALIFKGFNKCVPSFSGRWTPLYLEHGRLEVDDSSIKWCAADGSVVRVPAARLSAILLGPGTTITHAAITSLSRLNTPVVWVGEDGVRFYAFGVDVNERCQTTIDHALLYADEGKRLGVARKMFTDRFPGVDVQGKGVEELRGMEGVRVRDLYAKCAKDTGVSWTGRNASGTLACLGDQDDLNRMITLANHTLYCVCLAAITTMGYLPSLGFVHKDGKIPFVYDIADLYKAEVTILPCFEIYSKFGGVDRERVLSTLKMAIEKHRVVTRLPTDLKRLMC